MLLFFKTKFPWGEPTNFQDKIVFDIKIHAIRRDLLRQWENGRIINCATRTRTKNYNCFAKRICEGIQEILILTVEHEVKIVTIENFITETKFKTKFVYRKLSDRAIDLLAKNEGFDSTSDFWRWFDKPFAGIIIHWTELRY